MGKTMRGSFIADAQGRPVSALIGDEALGLFSVGQRVLFDRDVNMSPHTTVKAGERGLVDYVDGASGQVDIKLAQMHKGLSEWDNCVTLLPYDTEDLTGAVLLQRRTCSGRERFLMAACVVTGLLFVTEVVFSTSAWALGLAFTSLWEGF